MSEREPSLKPLATGEHRCIYCARVGTRGFLNKYGDYSQDYGYYCENRGACAHRAVAAGLGG